MSLSLRAAKGKEEIPKVSSLDLSKRAVKVVETSGFVRRLPISKTTLFGPWACYDLLKENRYLISRYQDSLSSKAETKIKKI